MKKFRSLEDVEKAGLPDEVYRVVHNWLRELIGCYAAEGYEYDPEADGHAVLIEPGDTDDAIREAIGYSLLDAAWEGASLTGGHFIAVLMHNNQFGITVFIEDTARLDPAVRARLMREL